MKSAQRNTERKQTNQRNCLRFFQNMTGPEIGISIKKPGKYQGKRNRKHSSRQKIVPCAPGMPESDLGGCEPGNGSLDTGSAHRQDQKLQRKDELENSQLIPSLHSSLRILLCQYMHKTALTEQTDSGKVIMKSEGNTGN